MKLIQNPELPVWKKAVQDFFSWINQLPGTGSTTGMGLCTGAGLTVQVLHPPETVVSMQGAQQSSTTGTVQGSQGLHGV